MKNIVSFFLLLTMIFLSAGCEQTLRQPDKKITEVTFWHSMAGAHLKMINKFAKEFEALHPDIRINPVYQGGYDNLHQKLIASLTAGTHPSMAQMYESWTTRFIERDLIDPVENFIYGENGLTQEELDDIYPAFIKNSTWDDKLVTLPFNKSAYMLFYNENMLKENGFSEPPKDWNQFLDACIKVTKKDGDKTIRYGYAVRPFIEGLTVLLFANEAGYMSDDGKKFLLNEKDGSETFRYAVEIVSKHKVGYVETDYLTSAFGSEKIAMYIGSTASFPYNDKAVGNKFKWGAAKVPAFPGKGGKTLSQGTNIGIFKKIDPKEREAAWLFLKYITDTERATQWAIETGYLPIRKSCLEKESMKKYLDANPNYKIVLKEMDYLEFEPRFVYWESIREVITREFDSAMNGRNTIDESMEKITKKCNYIIETER